MSTPIGHPLPTYQFPARPRCTPRRTVRYIVETLSFGLVGGWGFGGFLGVVVFLLILGVPVVLDSDAGGWRVLPVISAVGAMLLGYVGYRAKRRDGADRDDTIVAAVLFGLAGALIGAAPIALWAAYAFVVGLIVGTIPGVAVWLIYGLALVLFTVRRYSPSMDVAAFRRDARRLAGLTTWLSIGPLGTILYLILGDPTSTSDVLTALVLLTTLASVTAPFAWWHSKFLIDWWLRDIERSSAA